MVAESGYTEGHADAQYNLGAMYANGEGVPQDSVKAVEWWQKAATQGHADAQYNLGRSYYKRIARAQSSGDAGLTSEVREAGNAQPKLFVLRQTKSTRMSG